MAGFIHTIPLGMAIAAHFGWLSDDPGRSGVAAGQQDQ
jgi:hypothetical protein